MALIGEKVLPESVNSRRRQIRARVMDLREPIRSRRRRMVPGDFNLIGMVESNVAELRDRFVTRQSVLDRIRARRQNGQNQNQGQDADVQDNPPREDNNKKANEVLN